jgi:DNA-binding transcriptional LysR family regulator
MTDFYRFPHTPHLAWLGSAPPRDDKVLTPQEAKSFLSTDVLVEEKVDGANLGFSVDAEGVLRAQNRGSYIDLESAQGQWRPLRRWVTERGPSLPEAIGPDLMLFGEWCYAVHSLEYSRLPDWFLLFDVYERSSGRFWSCDRRNALAERLGLALVPRLGAGRFTAERLVSMLGSSHVGEGPAEGLYVRREEGGYLGSRAKIVRREFVQAIEEHWSRRAIRPNALAPDAGNDAWR